MREKNYIEELRTAIVFMKSRCLRSRFISLERGTSSNNLQYFDAQWQKWKICSLRAHTNIKVNAWKATLLLAMTNGYWTVIATETIKAKDWKELRSERCWKEVNCVWGEKDLRYMDVMCMDMSIKCEENFLRLKFDTHNTLFSHHLT